MYKRLTHLENFNFNHVVPQKKYSKKGRPLNTDPSAIPKKLGTAKGATSYGKPLSPELRKRLKEFKRRRET
jgi:hypothetical protein